MTNDKTRIIIVDDELLIVQLIKEHVEAFADSTITFTDAESAVRWARNTPCSDGETPTIWVTDLCMRQGSGGMSLIRWIKQNRPGDHVIVFSSHSEPPVVWMAINHLGATAYIVKDTNALKEVKRAVVMLFSETPYSNDIMIGLPQNNPSVIAKLTEAQRRILVASANASNQQEVADNLLLNKATVSRGISMAEELTGLPSNELITLVKTEGWDA